MSGKIKCMKNITAYIVPLLLLLMFSCGQTQQEKNKVNPSDYEEELLEANRHVVKTETQHIEDFLRRYKWDMEESGSGLRYMIYHEGDGQRAQKGMVAAIDYTVKMITGDTVYSSDELGPLVFIIGNGEVISGLEEGILYMNVGDKAKFIIPSHLAYGLAGDGNLIPAKSTLIYDVELLNLTQTN
jgi:FKBP-type peptidyl-prolyl cis-trans isomerase